jgi:hypothetical protein
MRAYEVDSGKWRQKRTRGVCFEMKCLSIEKAKEKGGKEENSKREEGGKGGC